MKKIKDYIFISAFIVFIFSFTSISILQSDKEFSSIENKILTKNPKLNLKDIKNGTYMKSFDKYIIDQFPGRISLICAKNKLQYALGYREFKNIYIGKNDRMLEKFEINKSNINENIEMMNKIQDYFNIETVGMFIPNSIAIYNEELPKYAITDNQKELLEYIENSYNGSFYTPYNALYENKNEYIYFKTDHHWTQLGAKIMYEDYYNKTINSKYEKVTDGFLGTYYSKTLLNSKKSDDIYAYIDFKDIKITHDGTESNYIYDDSKLEGKNKYQYFMNGDPAVSLIEGKGEGEILIFKDSFAHSYIPFLTNEYEKIHVLDPRYLNIDIIDYIKNTNITKIYYIYSLSTLNSDTIFNKYKQSLQ